MNYYGDSGGALRSALSSPFQRTRSWAYQARARWLIMSWRTRITIFLFACATGLVGSLATGFPLTAGTLIAGGVVLAVAVIVGAPNAVALGTVIAVYCMLLIPVSALFAASALGNQEFRAPDVVGGTVSLLFSYVVAIWVCSRFGRGRLWVSAALLAGSTFFPGIPLVLEFPSLGLNAARLSMLVVILLRSGAFWWLAGMIRVLRSRNGIALTPQVVSDDVFKSLKRWQNTSSSVQLTASLLMSIPEAKPYFSVYLPKATGALDAFVIHKTGGFLVATVEPTGAVSETSSEGIIIPGVDISQVANSLLGQRERLRRILRCNIRDLEVIIVIADREDFRHRLGVYAGTRPIPIATVVLVSPDKLKDEITERRRVWMASSQRVAGLRISPYRNTPVFVDTKTSTPSPVFVAGDDIVFATSDGRFAGVRVRGAQHRDKRGEICIPVCLADKYRKEGTLTKTDVVLLPVRAVETLAADDPTAKVEQHVQPVV